ncbi:MAG TPA: GxxExxY protein [Pyrinomonadaceae bacterium]|nr:GxxExxY protein [Pyrinomonadaceae bacterium]
MNILTQRDSRTYKIIGAAMEVHRQLGCGFLESIYQEALALELKDRGIPFTRELKFPVIYKGQHLNSQYRPDFICFSGVIVELKALNRLSPVDDSQLINYLKVTGYHTGLLLNFGAPSLEKRRFVLS